jgi:glycosyltransferase involved in cell wall biosynthesis
MMPELLDRTAHGVLRDKSAAPPWVLVSGGFHRQGGMDKANFVLAQYLAGQGVPLHIVCHFIDDELARHPMVTVHKVSRPAHSYFLGSPLLDFAGRRVAQQVLSKSADARVVVNGANCLWPGINWVHCVHHVWEAGPLRGPVWFRAKHALNRLLVLRQERAAARIGRLFIANSDRTRHNLIEVLGIDPELVHTVYLGAEPGWGLVTTEEKSAARQAFEIPDHRRVAAFIGTITHDRNKGFDVALEAWRKLCSGPDWDVDLLIAGGGGALDSCRQKVAQWKLEDRIRLLGFSNHVRELLAAADVLVSPVRYEAYGLNVQEAICRGVPAIVSSSAGVAERYASEYVPLLLKDPNDVDDLVAVLRQWRSNMEEWKSRFARFGDALRGYGWQDMARGMVSLVDQEVSPGARERAREKS